MTRKTILTLQLRKQTNMFKPLLLLGAFTFSVGAMEPSELTNDDKLIIAKIRHRIHDEFSYKQLPHENKFGTETKAKLFRTFIKNKEKNLDYITCINKYEHYVEKEVTNMLKDVMAEYKTFTESHRYHTHTLFASFLRYDDFQKKLIHEFNAKYINPVRIAHQKIRKEQNADMKTSSYVVADDSQTMTLDSDETPDDNDDMMEVEI